MENNHYIIHPITSQTKILIDENPPQKFSQEIQNKIDIFWQAKIDAGASLFDGKLFNITHISRDVIKGHFIHYRTFLAWRYTELRNAYSLKTMALSSITCANNYFLVGKRALNLAQYPNLYEFAPSGGVDAECEYDGEIILKELAHRELLEETGITPDHIAGLNLIAAIEGSEEGTLSMCMKIDLKSDLEELHPPLDEYSELHWLNKDQIHRSIEHKREAWLPFSVAFWDFWEKQENTTANFH